MGKVIHFLKNGLVATLSVLVILWLVGFIPGVSAFINTNIIRKS